ncbi:MAG: shikimate dehydrogenase [Chitinophagaceae bacterium]|jgi:shikimate dehydrogenase|nr:shikimate dehydrogenase [Chitinophagaceae bacterium]
MELYGLIGYPLTHSFSKQYFTEKFIRENLSDCVYKTFAIESITEFPAIMAQNSGLKGLSVTIPYKEQVLPYVTELSEEVKYIGATNSIKISGNKLTAYNTDIVGFELSFLPLLKPHHKKALVLGTGGASKAVQYVLKKLNISFIIVSRNENFDRGIISYESISKEIINEYNIIINCTPAGMHPDKNTFPDIPYHLLNTNHYLFDLIYKPAKTIFLQKGEQAGATIKNGYDMLIAQAEASWKIWNEK